MTINFARRQADDEWWISSSRRSIRNSGAQTASQGHTKGAYFAWKLAEGNVIEQTTGEKRLWLADDPLSEMDRRRALGLLDLFRNGGQVMLTAARDANLGVDTLGFARGQVHDGSVTSLD